MVSKFYFSAELDLWVLILRLLSLLIFPLAAIFFLLDARATCVASVRVACPRGSGLQS
jgi:hypothetical protein